MPIYEYHCANCGADVEIFQHMTDPPMRLCPQCSVEGLEKVFSPVGIVFKGSGFYSTDSKKASAALKPAEPKSVSEHKAASDATPAGAEPASTSHTPAPASTPATSSVDKTSTSSTSVDK